MANRHEEQSGNRTLPRDLDAERAVLGSILLDSQMCDEVALVLRADDFYLAEHQTLFGHIQAIHNESHNVDILLLANRLRREGEFDAVGGAAALAEIAQCVPTAANAVHYAAIVRDKALLRALIHTSNEVQKRAFDETEEPRELLNFAEREVFLIKDQRSSSVVKTIEEALNEALDQMYARSENGASGVPTGLVDLDQLLGGLQKSELIILAARPSMGKTALATNIAEHAALRENTSTLFVSLEMSRLELANRMLCSIARVDSQKVRHGYFTEDDSRKLVKFSSELSQAPLFIDDTPSRTVSEISSVARRLKHRRDGGGLGLIVIDYLQLIEPDNQKDARQEQVAKIARRLKMLSRELEVPVLCLAQLNRQAEVSRDNRPRLSHLRESGAIEQDADVVMFVHREEYYHTQEEARANNIEGRAEIIVAKQRNGPIGEIHLTWFKQFTRFENNSERRQEQYVETY
jgi:replicative DNA helicase